MSNYYLAVDIGASSGRHILAHMEKDRLVLEEVHRFFNGMQEKDGHKIWDVDALFAEILAGMKKCKDLGKIPVSVGIDTWAVDYVLLDENGNRLTDAYAYRDSRTEGMDTKVYARVPEKELYAATGIQKQPFNTIYQLMAQKESDSRVLDRAHTFLMIPDYFHYLLTGKAVCEYTNASTTQLLSPVTKQWDGQLMETLGFPTEIFPQPVLPGTDLGELLPEIAEQVGYQTRVCVPATHDTASAVMAVPAEGEQLYISSGTWSLMGTELFAANCSEESRRHNLTNEGGYDYRFRYLKNIMGMWMINSAKAELAPDMSYGDLCVAASHETIASVVNANDDRFLAPASMSEEVRKACAESGQQIPETPAQMAAVIYHSLAKCYADTAKEIEEITGKTYDCIHIVGGGANAAYLNELTAKACGKTVYTGPIEATAIGNIAAQMISSGEVADLSSARKMIFESFEIQSVNP